MDKKVSLSIVLYNNDKHEIISLVSSILNYSNEHYHIYIIDNSTTDIANTWFNNKRILYYKSDNMGFGYGHNIAMKLAIQDGSQFHFIVNPDIILEENNISDLVEYISNNDDIGVLMPKIISKNGELQYLCKLLPSPIDWLVRRVIVFKSIKERIDYTFEMRFSDYDETMEVPFLSGCFLLFNLNIFKKIEMFDENIFMYCEDIDLTRRIYTSKYKSLYYPSVSIIHNHMGGSKTNRRLLKYAIKSSIYYFNKWGWFFDESRKKINKGIKQKYK